MGMVQGAYEATANREDDLLMQRLQESNNLVTGLREMLAQADAELKQREALVSCLEASQPASGSQTGEPSVIPDGGCRSMVHDSRAAARKTEEHRLQAQIRKLEEEL